MKRIKALSITLALMLVFSLLPMTAFAADEGVAGQAVVTAPAEPEQYDDFADDVNEAAIKAMESAPIREAAGEVITPVNINNSSATANWYQTATVSSSSINESFVVNMSNAGTLAITYKSLDTDNVFDTVDNKYSSYKYSTVKDGITYETHYWYLNKGSHTLAFSLYKKGTYARFYTTYAPATMNITAGTSQKTYILGRPADYSTESYFKIKAPGKGRLDLVMGDGIRDNYIYYKTAGFSGFETLKPNDAGRTIGVKSGVYTFSVKSSTPLYGVVVKYNKVTESKFGTKKSKAKSIKKNKTRKGLIITNAKKSHWYKFKNTKTKKVRITVKCYISAGNSYGGLKVTLYDKRGSFGSRIIYPGESYTFKPYTIGKGSKLVKGTYRIKVQSYNGGNGYFTVKWK